MSEKERTEKMTALGHELIEVLQLKVKRNGRVDTTWGDKTPLGLGLTVHRIVTDNKEK